MGNTDTTWTRRKLLKNIGLLTAAIGSGVSLPVLAETKGHDHHHMHAVDTKLQAVIDQMMACIKNGEICSQHCIDLVKSGDTTIAECMDSVQEMLATCTAATKLAIHESKHLKAMMNVCMDVCKDCEKECREHEEKHAACKACADACADTIKACQAYLA